jgi:hypothetical protein
MTTQVRKLRETRRIALGLSLHKRAGAVACGLFVAAALVTPAVANVITDWDAKGVALAAPGAAGEREMAIMHLAMFDTVNAIERRFRPYLVQADAPVTASEDAAAAAAAAAVLESLHPEAAADIKATLAMSLAAIPNGDARTAGVKLGEAVAAKILAARANDGSNAPDQYRPRTSAGVYVPTPAVMIGSAWPKMRPFAIPEASYFRPPPPISLQSKEWAADYNEIKDLGGKASEKRTPRQTETAKFWLMVGPPAYHPVANRSRSRG